MKTLKITLIAAALALGFAAGAMAQSMSKIDQARTDANKTVNDARKDATDDKTDAQYTVAKEKCNAFADAAKDLCLEDTKAKFGRK